MDIGTIYNTAILLGIAKTAYERINSGASDTEPHNNDAIVAVVFSAAALEAFINELADLAAQPPIGSSNPASVQMFASLVNEIEESRGTTRLKYMVARSVFTGEPYDKSAPPYQDFALLFRLRDALIHLKSENKFEYDAEGNIVSSNYPKVVGGLPRHILAKFDDKVTFSWLSWIGTKAVARWACNVACQMASSLLGSIPEGHFRRKATFIYGRIFQPVV